MNENERIINDLEDSLASMAKARTDLELVRHRMNNGIKDSKNYIVTFDIDVLDATILGMAAHEQLVRTLLVEYKARQD